jgi:hypothetical protein
MHKKMDTGNQPVPISNENVGSEAVLDSAFITLDRKKTEGLQIPPSILLFCISEDQLENASLS